MKSILKLLLISLIPISILLINYIIENDISLFKKEIDSVVSTGNWKYRKRLDIKDITQEQIETESINTIINTEELISEGKMKQDCSDMRFLLDDMKTPAEFQIIDGCNTENTEVEIKVPGLDANTYIIYLLYGLYTKTIN